MKLNYLIMASLTAIASLASCSQQEENETIIGKPEVTVTDGKFTPEVLKAMAKVGGAQVAPDESKILLSVKYESVELNKGNAELWTMDLNGENQTKITNTASSEGNAVWLANSKQIAFTYAVDGKPQIFVMNADGSGRKQLSNVSNGVEGFLLSPDEKKIAVISTVKAGQTTADLYPELSKASGRIVDDLMYKHWDEWVTEIPHTFVADFDTDKGVGELKDVLEGEPFEAPMRPFGGSESLAWGADGKTLIYVCRKKTGLEYSLSTNSDLYEYNLETGNTRNLTEGMMGYDTCPRFSADGNTLAWLSMEHDGFESDKNRLFVMNIKSGEKRDLTADWDYSIDDFAWAKDDKGIYFLAAFQGTEPMFKIDVESCKVDTVATGVCDYASLAPLADGSVIAARHSLLEPNDIYACAMGAEPKKLTGFNDDILAQIAPVSVQKELVPTTDGKLMTTWVVLPPNFDANKKYPALLYCQGGPQSAVSQFWSERWNLRLMASQGYIVIAPNRRGLPGFGTEWNAQISGDYPGQNMKDYFSAVDYMREKPFVDRDHIGAVGASYGGFSVYWLAGHHEGRFAALIAHAGIFNIEAQYLETEEMWFANWDMGGAPWDKANAVAQRTFANSPHLSVDKWTAPILVTVGERDYRILASQGMMAFNAAKLRGIPARMVVFPDENHWILQPQNGVLFHKEFFRWLDQWLKPAPEK